MPAAPAGSASRFHPPDDPAAVGARVREATQRLLATVARLDAVAAAEPSPLPGWTRAHVVAHLAGNADGSTRLLQWAATGVPTPKYASAQAREEEIAAIAARPWPGPYDALVAASARLEAQHAAMDAAAWAVAVPDGPGGSGEPRPAATVPWTRWREVEVHHVDLDAGATPAHWPDGFAELVVLEAADRLVHRPRPPEAPAVPSLRLAATDVSLTAEVGPPAGAVAVSGPARALAAWLTRRSSGDGLVVEPPGPLPTLPPWG